VELRGFEPLTSAVQAPARLTGPPLPVLQSLIADARLWIPRRRRGRWRSVSLGAQLATGDPTRRVPQDERSTSRLFSLARLTRNERVPNDRANTNGNADAPSGRAVG
jgi:hypothetical protein